VRIAILGPLDVRDAAGQPCPVSGARLRSFVIRLAINGGRPVSADLLAEDLWPDDPPADTMNAIQALASRVRSAAGRGLIEHGPAGYRLAVAAGDIDTREFGRLAAAGQAALAAGDPATAREQLGQALALWRGPALADVADAPFAAATITRLAELRLAATEDRIDACLSLGQGAGLVAEVEELASAHPLRERLRGQLMRALQAAGRQAEALRVYEDTRKTLAAELGVDPSPGLAEIHLAVLRGEPLPGLVTPKSADAAATATGTTAASPVPRTAAFAPAGSPPPGPGPGTPAAHPENGSQSLGGSTGQADSPSPGLSASRRRPRLPAQLTTFVGRDDELTRVSQLLTTARLVTLTGPGGAGKTRLSIEAASRVTSQIPDGAWFVPLAPVRDALDVPQAVLTAIGAAEAWPDPAEAARLAALSPVDRLCEVLAARELLLVLDNCEHVIDAVAELAARVLAEDPGVRILATSREPLGLTGETLCPVPSLPLPPAGAGPDEAAGYAAVRLFTDRATAVRPGFTLDGHTAAPVVRICRALDGIPLAIELAAARVRSLTPVQVADRLDDRFALLSVTTRGKMPRHQTLRAIVDWSWDLLDDTERTILRRLSVFAGGATPGSAEEVCALAGRRDQTVDVIAALVDKSLVIATGDGAVRYRLLETVRAYAAERLAEAGETGKIADTHAQYFLDLAEAAEPQIRSHDQLAWLDRLSAEHDNCSAALRHFIDTGDGAAALRMIQALAWFWIMRDYDAEAGEWAAQALALTGDQAPPGLADAHTIARIVLAVWRGTRGKMDLPKVKESLADLDRPGPPPRHPLLALALPLTAMLSGDFDRARKKLTAGLDHPDPWAQAGLLAFSGHLAINAGEIDVAAAQLADSYARFEALGDRWGLSVCLAGMGEVAMAHGEPAEAVRALEEARGHAAAGVAGNMGEMMRIPLGRAKAEAGDIEGGRADLESGVRTAERLGEHDDAASGQVELAEIARRGGDLAESRRRLELAVQMVEPRQLRPDVAGVAATTYARLGSLAEQEGDLATAADWLRRAIAVLASDEASMLPSNQPLGGVVSGIAALAAARGDCLRAAELLGLAHTLLGYSSTSSLEVARAAKAIAAAPDQAAVRAAYERGQSLTRDEALNLVP
jgi:predicted ATPase/DNA-binding SARP family transcriptional activator